MELPSGWVDSTVYTQNNKLIYAFITNDLYWNIVTLSQEICRILELNASQLSSPQSYTLTYYLLSN